MWRVPTEIIEPKKSCANSATFEVTLSSIGDAVITTDQRQSHLSKFDDRNDGRRLGLRAASGENFNIINEDTRSRRGIRWT